MEPGPAGVKILILLVYQTMLKLGNGFQAKIKSRALSE